jgi:hypothetical protein
MKLSKDTDADANIGTLIGVIIFVLVAAVLYPLIGGQVDDLTCETGEAYVGEDSAPLVSMVPIFYWLAVALAVIAVALVSVKGAL